ncbi:hypothetical protein PoB_003825500 [Plakobranchus ocellatus]|uniref:Uncharacterized protein n=1 Tax=Plakobranchus ocellatus TaxID=259542 RepID=A0AAV4AWW8_9GAST|nr:hypothetical protein PoB_003825500 [Plakobranchus ocellatus]
MSHHSSLSDSTVIYAVIIHIARFLDFERACPCTSRPRDPNLDGWSFSIPLQVENNLTAQVFPVTLEPNRPALSSGRYQCRGGAGEGQGMDMDQAEGEMRRSFWQKLHVLEG